MYSEYKAKAKLIINHSLVSERKQGVFFQILYQCHFLRFSKQSSL